MSSIDGNAHLGKTLANEATPTPQVVLWWLAVAPNEGLRLWSSFGCWVQAFRLSDFRVSLSLPVVG
jgi:hypothetical protein